MKEYVLTRTFKNAQPNLWAVVVTQLIELLLPITEVRGSNKVIGNIYIEHLSFTNEVSE